VNNYSETERILHLNEFGLDYTSLQEEFSVLTRLACKVTGSEISMVNLIDQYSQWSISREGIDLLQIDRSDAVCNITIKQHEPFEVPDLSTDPRFSHLFYVEGEPYLRHYFGVPLVTDGGFAIGAICVLSPRSQSLTDLQKEMMQLIAKEVVKRLELIKEFNLCKDNLRIQKQVVYKVAHDVRGPVSGIQGLLDIILATLNSGGAIAEISEMVTLARQSAAELLNYSHAILSESNSVLAQASVTTIDVVAAKLQAMFAPQAQLKLIKFKIVTGNGQFVIPSENVPRMLQIASNLLGNAFKFTQKEGEVELQITTEKVADKKERVVLRVSDSGMGLTKEQIEAIYSGQKNTSIGTLGEKGYGFGLTMVQQMVKNIGATWLIESSIGIGTQISIFFPAENTSPAQGR
jgi:signal transduction histidine kinase